MEEIYRLYNKFIILREVEDDWAINILPDSVLIDNFHGHHHIHIEKKLKVKISFLIQLRYFLRYITIL